MGTPWSLVPSAFPGLWSQVLSGGTSVSGPRSLPGGEGRGGGREEEGVPQSGPAQEYTLPLHRIRSGIFLLTI